MTVPAGPGPDSKNDNNDNTESGYSTGLEVSLVDVWPVFQMAIDAGISLQNIVLRLGLAKNLLDKPEGYILLADYIRILAELSLIYFDETCNLSERPLIIGTTQFALTHLNSCSTLREALYKVAEVSNLLNGGPYNKVKEADGLLMFTTDDSRFPYLLETQSFLFFGMECVQILMHGMLCHITGFADGVSKPSVSIKRSADSSARHLHFWNDRIRYNSSHYVLSYDASVGDIPMKVPEGGFTAAALFTSMVNLCKTAEIQTNSFMTKEKVRGVLLERFKDQSEVASQLGMSVATMRRRLSEEETSFREVRQDVMQTQAIHLLDAGYHTDDVAEKLGFSDLRSFSRAFKSWYGSTPSEYRERKG